MKHIKLSTLNLGRIGLGAMSVSPTYTGHSSHEAESIRAITEPSNSA